MCYEPDARPPFPPISGAAVDGEDIVLTAGDGTRFSAYAATSAGNTGAQVLIFPDVRGLHGFYKDLAVRFAGAGLPALAIDYFGRTAGTAPRPDNFEYQTHVERMTMPTFLLDVTAALDHLRRSNPKGHLFVVGFCRGGTLSLHAGAEDFNLSGIIAFYPGLSRPIPGAKATTLERAAHIKSPLLGLFGGADPAIPPGDVEQLDKQLDAARVNHEIVVYPGAPHSFFDRRNLEFAEASADAWRRILGFLRAF